MSEFLDDLYNGIVSRRSFLEKLSVTAAGLPLFTGAVAGAAEPQSARPPAGSAKDTGKQREPDIDELPDEQTTYSPPNIGGGGQVNEISIAAGLRIRRYP